MVKTIATHCTFRDLAHATISPGSPVLVRVDLNIPWQDRDDALSDGGARGRVAATIPCIRALLQKKAIVVLLTHWGDPHGKYDALWSTARLAPLVTKRLKKHVTFVKSVFGEDVRRAIAAAKPGSVLLLENVRFWRAEEKDDDAFARALAAPFSAFVYNAFGVAHRAHASIHAITRHVPAYAGPLLVQEVRALTQEITHPFVCILGGAKLETKVALIERMSALADTILLGGGVAIAVQVARGDNVPGAGGAFRRKDILAVARKLLQQSERKLVLPRDVVALPHEERVLDIGPQSQEQFMRILAQAKTVLWNGPLGIIEEEDGRAGTRAIARVLQKCKGQVFVGGGDTVSFLEHEGLLASSWHVSTGGGAMLAFLAGERMPGLEGVLLDK